MIVKIHNRGTGRGSGPIDYLLGKDRDREGATLISGDLVLTEKLIDESVFAKKYTSGVLSFAENDLDPQEKREIMADFEAALLPGMAGQQFKVLWVEHRDKDRLELNFVIPNTELTTGKRLQPYFHGADKHRMGHWQDAVNAEKNLADPNDPTRKRTLATPRDLPPDRQQAAEAITSGLIRGVASGEITDRAGVLEALQGAGFEIARQGKDSISIKSGEGQKNLRLKGAIYEQDFRGGHGLQRTIEEAGRKYDSERQSRAIAARTELDRGIEIKRAELEKRYQQPRQPSKSQAEINADGQRDRVGKRPSDSRSDNIGAHLVEQRPGTDHIRATADIGRTGGQDGRGDSERDRRGVLLGAEKESRHTDLHDKQRPTRDKADEIGHDTERTSVIKRAFDAAKELRNRLAGIAGDVRAYIERKRPNQSALERLERASVGFKHGISVINEVTLDRNKAKEADHNQNFGGYSR